MLKSRDSIGFDNRSHVAMPITGDPAIGDEGDANPTVYRMVAMTAFDHNLSDRHPCPVCGYFNTEHVFIELYMTPWGLHLQLLLSHPGTNGEEGGCFWSCPVNSHANIARVGPLAHGDARPSG
jgi:hypothetical protein